METQATLPATSRPSPGVVFVGAVWLLSYFVARSALEAWAPRPHWDIAVACLPLLAFYWFVWVVQRTLRAADELRRRIHLEALALAFLTTMVVIMVLGLLDAPPVGPLGLPLRDVWLVLPLLYGLCFAVANQRYR